MKKLAGSLVMAQRKCSNGLVSKKLLTLSNMNPHIKAMEYVVRGPLIFRAAEIERELGNGVKKPFEEVIHADIGDAHAMGQQPITFIRQVLALVAYPELIHKLDVIPEDVKAKAKELLGGTKGSGMGAYTDGPGIEIIRKHAAEYIQRRDGGIPARPQDIMLSAGATEGIRATMRLFINGRQGKDKPGVMIPIPQYPLYSVTISEFNFSPVNYYLDEDTNWSLDLSELERAYAQGSKNCKVSAIVIINPGNPTGQVLPRENIAKIIKFAHQHKLFIFADEVYQDNAYAEGSAFHSFKKVLMELGPPYDQVELASFFSISKGYTGECGLRGGYQEIINVDPDVKAMLLKSISTNKTCPTSLGQAALDCVVDPPSRGSPSYDLWLKEKTAVLGSLAQRAKMVADTYNTLPGLKCNVVQGAMYAFPQITFPAKAIEAAKAKGQQPDVFYAFELLENTGICIVPGSVFGQKPGTYHFRTTILPQPALLEKMLSIFGQFHRQFMEKYA